MDCISRGRGCLNTWTVIFCVLNPSLLPAPPHCFLYVGPLPSPCPPLPEILPGLLARRWKSRRTKRNSGKPLCLISFSLTGIHAADTAGRVPPLEACFLGGGGSQRRAKGRHSLPVTSAARVDRGILAGSGIFDAFVDARWWGTVACAFEIAEPRAMARQRAASAVGGCLVWLGRCCFGCGPLQRYRCCCCRRRCAALGGTAAARLSSGSGCVWCETTRPALSRLARHVMYET